MALAVSTAKAFACGGQVLSGVDVEKGPVLWVDAVDQGLVEVANIKIDVEGIDTTPSLGQCASESGEAARVVKGVQRFEPHGQSRHNGIISGAHSGHPPHQRNRYKRHVAGKHEGP